MSTAVMSSPIFECTENIFKSASSAKAKDASPSAIHTATGNGTVSNNGGHTPLRRSYTSLVTSLLEHHRKLDRSASEPTSRYKTELCRPYEESGACKYGDKCQFAHGYTELRNLARHPKYKTELCRTFHTIGFCPYGPRCHFIHNIEEARLHNQKVSAQLGLAQPNIMNLNPLLSVAAAAAVANSGNNSSSTTNSVKILEQLAASPQIQAVAAANTPNLMRANSLSMCTSNNTFSPPPLLRTNSLTTSQQHHLHHHHNQHHHQNSSTSVNSVIGATRPKPLNLSPAFSLGSTGDSISPASSLSQSPTNSMQNFFDECQQVPHTNLSSTSLGYLQELGLLPAVRQSPSPRTNSVCSPLGSDDLSRRTPSPTSPNNESRLPVFNRISNVSINDFENLKI